MTYTIFEETKIQGPFIKTRFPLVIYVNAQASGCTSCQRSSLTFSLLVTVNPVGGLPSDF